MTLLGFQHVNVFEQAPYAALCGSSDSLASRTHPSPTYILSPNAMRMYQQLHLADQVSKAEMLLSTSLLTRPTVLCLCTS